jgi:DNA-binding phage protein
MEEHYGPCTISTSHEDGDLAIILHGHVKHVEKDYVKVLSPLSRSVAVTDAGYVAYHTGEHREQVFKLLTWEGEPVIQRISEVARTPTFTPNGDYVAFWRLTDHTVYCYDTNEGIDTGQFDTDQLRDTNIGVRGTTYDGVPAFGIFDTKGTGRDTWLGNISPSGELLASVFG